MNKKVELPIVEPMYSTYHNQCAATAMIGSNPSIRNWELNESVALFCERKFLNGLSTPLISVVESQYELNPHLDSVYIDLAENKQQFNALIRHFVDSGYYVYFNNVDDYYLDGKTWYKQRHFYHDGLICGYDRESKAYCIYAYDISWKLNKLWIPYRSFNKGLQSMRKVGRQGYIIALKPTDTLVAFEPSRAIINLKDYLNSTFEMYPTSEQGIVFGIIVHDYIAMYLDRIAEGLIPHERVDRRVFRVIWEQKKVMLERIQKLEETLDFPQNWSVEYEKIVREANNIRLVYASYTIRKKETSILIIKEKLLWIKQQEEKILNDIIKKTEGVIEDDTLEIHQK